MYNKFKKFRSDKPSKNQPNEELSYGGPKDAGRPFRSYEVDPTFIKKTFKDLGSLSFTQKIDPYTEINYLADPYAVINATNPIVDVKYAGQQNTSGNVIQQLAQGVDSTYADIPDSIQEWIQINYNFCKGNTNSNADVVSGLGTANEKMVKPFNDILTSIQGEANYSLPFFGWQVVGTGYSSDKMIDVLVNYQSLIQLVATIPLRYKVIRSLEKHLKDMCYMNGSNRLNLLYGLLKKAAFVNCVKSVSETILTQFLDTYWFNQISMLVAIPCRKSNSMTDPLIDIIPTYEINKTLSVTDSGGTTIVDFNNSAITSITTAANDFLANTSAQALLTMARNSALTPSAINSWFNTLLNDVTDIVNGMDYVTNAFKEMITAFKSMARVGYTEWKLGQFISLDHLEEAYVPKFNKLIYDIIRTSFTGSSTIAYDNKTNKWDCQSLWDKYLGMPTYDQYSGGCLLTTSTRTVDRTLAPSSVAIPVLFYGAGALGALEATLLTRGNHVAVIKPASYALADVTVPDRCRMLGRLVPISSLDTTTYVTPVCDITSTSTSGKTNGWIARLMNEIFGYGVLKTGASSYQYFAAVDSLNYVDFEIDDQTNAVTAFMRQHSPFRVVKTSLESYLGFITSR